MDDVAESFNRLNPPIGELPGYRADLLGSRPSSERDTAPQSRAPNPTGPSAAVLGLDRFAPADRARPKSWKTYLYRGRYMPKREEHCYRCGYVWTPRRRRARICSRCKSPYFWLPKLRIPSYGGGLGIREVVGPRRDEVLRIALRHGATDVRVFGSVARMAAGRSSDLDILVRPKSRKAFAPIDLALDLTKLLGRHVDVVSENSLHWLVQPQVISEAVPL